MPNTRLAKPVDVPPTGSTALKNETVPPTAPEECDVLKPERWWDVYDWCRDIQKLAQRVNDRVDEFANALPEKPGVFVWQPIATAPKDGTPILLCRRGVVTGEMFVISGSWNSGGAYHMPHWMTAANMHEPTHWMPIPPALAETPPALLQRKDDDLRYCLCADPENCREVVPGYVCRKWRPSGAEEPESGGGSHPLTRIEKEME